MSALDHLTDAEIEAAGHGVVCLMAALDEAKINPMKVPGMTQARLKALAALIVGVYTPPESVQIAGAPDDDFARAAAEEN